MYTSPMSPKTEPAHLIGIYNPTQPYTCSQQPPSRAVPPTAPKPQI